MTDLTPAELDALAHWSSFGRPGAPVTERYIPDADELARLKPFIAPASAAWPLEFDAAQTLLLLRGFPRGEMEDKWIIYSDGLTVHFHRSWTGGEIVRVELELTEGGSRVIRAMWETDAAVIRSPTEDFARATFAETCRWVLGFTAA